MVEVAKYIHSRIASSYFRAVSIPIIQGGAELTDTFQIWILRRRDSLSWLAGRGTVKERTPFHMVSRNGGLERATTCCLYSKFRRHRLACLVARTYSTRFYPVGVPARPCVPEAYHDYSRIQTSHCWRSCGYWWGPTEARVRQLPDTLATMQWCKQRPSAWCSENKLVSVGNKQHIWKYL